MERNKKKIRDQKERKDRNNLKKCLKRDEALLWYVGNAYNHRSYREAL